MNYKEKKFRVCIRCMTFNQSEFIYDTLNGFSIQKTNFPYICLIIDDASTDGEQDILNKYIKENCTAEDLQIEETGYAIIKYGKHRNNPNCYFALFFLKENHYSNPHKFRGKKLQYLAPWREKSDYEAMCEGDDYWVNPNKLQLQVDFMDINPDYGLIHTDFDLTKGRRRHIKLDSDDDGNWFPRILTDGMTVGTCTAMFRRSVLEMTPKLYEGKGWPMGDKPLWIELAYQAKVKYLPIVTARYRVQEYSASHSRDINKMINFIDASILINNFYAEHYHVPLVSDGKTRSYYETIVRYACRLNEKEIARQYFLDAKNKGLVSWKCSLFYLSTKYAWLKRVIDKYILI